MLFWVVFCLSLDAKQLRYEKKGNYDREINPEYGYRALRIIELLTAKDIMGKDKLVRIGNIRDGGYTMLDDFENITCAYSIGIADDWSFDSQLASRGIKVYMFDHSINHPILNNSFLKFYKYGINYVDRPKDKLLSLESMLRLDGNFEQTDMILKMDVEGYEWEVLAHSSILNHFSQIVVELHWFEKMILQKDQYFITLKALENLNKTHQLVWIHGITTPWTPATNLNLGGVPIPNQIEATFVRRNEDLKFVKYNNKKKRVDERNYTPGAETLIWWLEGGGEVDFDGLLNAYLGFAEEFSFKENAHFSSPFKRKRKHIRRTYKRLI